MFIARPQGDNRHNVIDSIFHFVSSGNWEIVDLSAEIQGRGGGGDAGGTTETSWDLFNYLLDGSATCVKYKNVARHFFFLRWSFYFLPDLSQPMEATGGFYFTPSRMFFTSLCRMGGLPPPSHPQTWRRTRTMRTCALQIDTWTPKRTPNTREAQGSARLRWRRCRNAKAVWQCLLCIFQQEQVARGMRGRTNVGPETEE